jgi:hypothetical protein
MTQKQGIKLEPAAHLPIFTEPLCMSAPGGGSYEARDWWSGPRTASTDKPRRLI